MKVPRAGNAPRDAEDRRLDAYIEGARQDVRAPRGFAQGVMNAVYREALAGRSLPGGAEAARVRAEGVVERATVSRMYRRLGVSFMLTAAVLAVSLLIPRGAYTSLIGSGGPNDALGSAPSAAVRGALTGAGHAVQGALGEQQIGGNQE
jgi:hypothetical protein